MEMKGKIECDNCSSIVCPLCGGGIEVRLFNERSKILTCSNRKVILIKGAFRIYLIFQCLFPFDRNFQPFVFETEDEFNKIKEELNHTKDTKKQMNEECCCGDETLSEENDEVEQRSEIINVNQLEEISFLMFGKEDEQFTNIEKRYFFQDIT